MILSGLVLWFSFIHLPASALADSWPQKWEACLGFAATHHLQWGRDIIYTYGPLGFLTTDYYWGGHFWLMFAWALGFSLVLTMVLLRFLRRTSWPVRVILCIALPFLTAPRSCDLGLDPVYLFAITLFGMICLAEEKTPISLLVISGCMLGLLGLVKFTFCLYCVVVLVAVVVGNCARGDGKRAGIIFFSALASFAMAWTLAGQSFGNIGLWFYRSLQIVSGYSSAMSIPTLPANVLSGGLIFLCLVVMLVMPGRNGRVFAQIPKIGVIAPGIFLAWKEAFDRADATHVMVFLIYAILLSATMPAFSQMIWRRRRAFLPWTVVTWALAGFACVVQQPDFVIAVKMEFGPCYQDKFTALLNPTQYRSGLEAYLADRQDAVSLPQIASAVGDAPLGVLGYNQEVAILNGFNYRPHPVFQGFSAYLPALQKLNSDFYASSNAPELVLWRFETLDHRFPTLDEGMVLLTMLRDYLPVTRQGEFVLWKRKAKAGLPFQFSNLQQTTSSLGEWVSLPDTAAWLKLDLQPDWPGKIREFFYQATVPVIEIRLADGSTESYQLTPGSARSGFVINPLLVTTADPALTALGRSKPKKVTAMRVLAPGGFLPVRIVIESIEGVPALDAIAPSPPTAP